MYITTMNVNVGHGFLSLVYCFCFIGFVKVAVSLQCYSCPSQSTAEGCQAITSCGPDQVCMLRRTINNLTQEILYESQCEDKVACDLELDRYRAILTALVGRKREMKQVLAESVCLIQCCDQDLCNNGCVKPTDQPVTATFNTKTMSTIESSTTNTKLNKETVTTNMQPTIKSVSTNTQPTTGSVITNTHPTTGSVSTNTQSTTGSVSANTQPTTGSVSANTQPTTGSVSTNTQSTAGSVSTNTQSTTGSVSTNTQPMTGTGSVSTNTQPMTGTGSVSRNTQSTSGSSTNPTLTTFANGTPSTHGNVTTRTPGVILVPTKPSKVTAKTTEKYQNSKSTASFSYTEQPTISSESTKVTPQYISTPADCPYGSVTFDTSCYLFGRQEMSFRDAKIFCAKYNSHLVHVDSSRENEFLKNHLTKMHRGPTQYWIGITDEETENVWRFYDNQKVATFDDWSPGEPDGTQTFDGNANADCAVFDPYLNFQWRDEDCSPYQYSEPVCEISKS